ncbi:MAG: hypothetical protein Q4F35_07195 [Akkermansia sp.]|nr:hypothetical protein [Akkermansia sp.]
MYVIIAAVFVLSALVLFQHEEWFGADCRRRRCVAWCLAVLLLISGLALCVLL